MATYIKHYLQYINTCHTLSTFFGIAMYTKHYLQRYIEDLSYNIRLFWLVMGTCSTEK